MERDIVAQRIKEFRIQEFMDRNLSNVGHSHTVMRKTPLGEKIVIYASRPGLIVGRKGLNIKELTTKLKKEFKLDNPQIEISEVKDIFLEPEIVAEKIAQSLERFGSQRFKGIGHKMMSRVMDSGALGVEILMSGKIPGARARTWRFYQGYLKKCGDVAVSGVKKAYRAALLKTGIIGIQVRIMPPDLKLPDTITIKEQPDEQEIEEKTAKKVKKPKKTAKKATSKKKTAKTEEPKEETEKKEEPKAEEPEPAEPTTEEKPQTPSSEEGNEEQQPEEQPAPTSSEEEQQ